jgi:hypothetical protein
MIVYGHHKTAVSPAESLAWCRRSIAEGDIESALIELGILEASALDAGVDLHLANLLDRTMRALGRALVTGEPPEMALDSEPFPAGLEAGVHEGFAYYSLFPSDYDRAAQQCLGDQTIRSATVVGVRSIGTTLSAVVAARFEQCAVEVRRVTVRPHGDPFDRCVELPELSETDVVAVVDEGPGLSGSSFGSVVRALRERQVPLERILIFSSWDPHPDQLRSDYARSMWAKVRRYPSIAQNPFPGWTDISAGTWREYLLNGSPWPASQPQHERRKFLSPDRARLAKFEGLGPYARQSRQLANELSSAGWSPKVCSTNPGFLITEVPGSPCRDVPPNELAAYLLFRSTLPAQAPGACPDELAAMIEYNTKQAGLECPRFCVPRDAVPVATDNRMLPHEFVHAGGRFYKTDAIDHCRDHFVPGCQDIAWDVAGAITEFDLDRASSAELVSQSSPNIAPEKLRFYEMAYLAFRLGYVRLARETWCLKEEQARYDVLESRYARRLKEHRDAE